MFKSCFRCILHVTLVKGLLRRFVSSALSWFVGVLEASRAHLFVRSQGQLYLLITALMDDVVMQ
uniref:Secreted protein n=1 Tax=Setaria viridis TaxID=4556 RepID=A0A4U6VR15_SETVI|nr:hypothetical protein SEVIR_2G162936v2 [Setaria viridis]